ncbi:MAG: hypothetical protein U0795_14015 [Pirellulales bacterium]
MNVPQPIATGTRFSLRSLLIVISACAVLAGLYQWIGAGVLLIGALHWVILAGVAAHQSRQAGAYWRCVSSGLILFLGIPWLNPRHFDYHDVLPTASLLGAGGFLAVASLRNAHWATRLSGIVLVVLWGIVDFEVLAHLCYDFGEFWAYWFD